MTIEIAETDSTTIDSDRWPDVARVPRGPVGAMIADRLIRRAAARLPVRLVYPDGTVVGAASRHNVLRNRRVASAIATTAKPIK